MSSDVKKKVFVSGCYDMLHSGHVAFFEEAATYGDLYVGIGSDKTIQELKENGFWVVGADMDKAVDYRDIQVDVPLLLVIGSEGFGISSLVKKHCDYMAALPMIGSVTSLNASVACGIMLYEIYSKRNPR